MMKNFVVVFPANHNNKFIDFKSMTSGGAHLTLNQNYPFVFDLFGIDGIKIFIIQGNESVIQKILFAIEKMTKADSKVKNSCKCKISDEHL